MRVWTGEYVRLITVECYDTSFHILRIIILLLFMCRLQINKFALSTFVYNTYINMYDILSMYIRSIFIRTKERPSLVFLVSIYLNQPLPPQDPA
jgi:hypothetical protein